MNNNDDTASRMNYLIDDLAEHGIFGKSIGYVYPVALAAEIVSGEIPTEENNPRSREIVLRCMMNGICAIRFPDADGKYPKEFNVITPRPSTGQAEISGVPMNSWSLYSVFSVKVQCAH